MRIRDKIITAACRTDDGIEWTSFKIKPEEMECIQQESRVIPLPADITDAADLATALPPHLGGSIQGSVTVALRTAELLMRTMEFPTTDPSEIADMVGFQVDKISPFPTDQLAISHEIVEQTEDTALVLMVAAKRSVIDDIGDEFKNHGVVIHSIDVRVLGWLQLLRDQDKISEESCEIYIINDGIELALVVLENGCPIAFRTLHAELDDMNVVEELTYEIGYTLTMLDSEHALPDPSSIQFWSFNTVPASLRTKLAEKTGLTVDHHDLAELPPLSEGIIRRTLAPQQQVELIPREWVELQQRRELRKKFTLLSGAVSAAWLSILLIFFVIYKTRDIKLNNTQERADEIAPAAKIALENRQKLKTLKVYTDRSDSSLECLREITALLPDGDIEFVSYNYKKDKGITLRGTAENDDLVYDFFGKLTASTLFSELKDESVNTKTTKGQSRAVFSATLMLTSEEDS